MSGEGEELDSQRWSTAVDEFVRDFMEGFWGLGKMDVLNALFIIPRCCFR